MDLALNNVERLIKTNQPTKSSMSILICFIINLADIENMLSTTALYFIGWYCEVKVV